ncbi:MAG: PLDc N-terminal domain-containing protein [Solirubrobacteraceae bacterium]|nr:PLDc N-terminal domain-containing protein [Solirubrobacteraceae bacterium]
MQRRKWSELTATQRRTIVVLAAVQFTLAGAMLRDLRRRPADEVRGPKRLWLGAAFVNTIGPLAYFAFGRRRQ